MHWGSGIVWHADRENGSFPIEISVISLKLSPKVAVVSTYTPITLPINFIATNICGYGRYAPICIPAIATFFLVVGMK